jgi:diguanylate cyclase (GGDEF)-like protein
MSALEESDVRQPPQALVRAIGGGCIELMQAGDLPMYVKTLDEGVLEFVSPAMANLAGSTPAALVGQSEGVLFGGEVPPAWRHAEQAAVARSRATVADAKVSAGGTPRELRVVRWPFAAEGAAVPTHVACLWLDQTRERQREAQLKQALLQLEQLQRTNDLLRREAVDAALRDRVTGLYTRGHFDDQLRREVDLSNREHREFALVMIALDPPSEAVRARGEAAQNRVLESLGRLLRGNTRAMDASCRVRDDRFAVLLSGVGLATAHSRMEGLRRQCATQIVVLDGDELGFTVSMGVASYPHTAGSQEELMSACERALVQAQSRGGNNVCLASIRLAVE